MTKQIWWDASYDDKRKVAGFGIVIKDKGVKTRSISNWIQQPAITMRRCLLYTKQLFSQVVMVLFTRTARQL